jgi:hypothetical protein
MASIEGLLGQSNPLAVTRQTRIRRPEIQPACVEAMRSVSQDDELIKVMFEEDVRDPFVTRDRDAPSDLGEEKVLELCSSRRVAWRGVMAGNTTPECQWSAGQSATCPRAPLNTCSVPIVAATTVAPSS